MGIFSFLYPERRLKSTHLQEDVKKSQKEMSAKESQKSRKVKVPDKSKEANLYSDTLCDLTPLTVHRWEFSGDRG